MKARVEKATLKLVEVLDDSAPEVGQHKCWFLPYIAQPDLGFDPSTHKLSEPSGGVVLLNGVPNRWEVVRAVVPLTEQEIEANEIKNRVQQMRAMVAVIEAGTESLNQRRQYLGALGRSVEWLLRKVGSL